MESLLFFSEYQTLAIFVSILNVVYEKNKPFSFYISIDFLLLLQ
jgi:hypothetical protein